MLWFRSSYLLVLRASEWLWLKCSQQTFVAFRMENGVLNSAQWDVCQQVPVMFKFPDVFLSNLLFLLNQMLTSAEPKNIYIYKTNSKLSQWDPLQETVMKRHTESVHRGVEWKRPSFSLPFKLL